MKIRIYQNWKETTDAPMHPIKQLGLAIFKADADKHSTQGIIGRITKFCAGKLTESGNYLVIVYDKKTNYYNSLIGNRETIKGFAIDCLEDEGYASNYNRKRTCS